MRVNCILRNTQAVSDLRKAIQILVAQRVQEGKSALFPEIYKEIRKEIEVDAESLGSIYNGLYGMQNQDFLSSIDDVVKFAGTDFVRQMNSIVEDIVGEPPVAVEEQIGKLSPERAAVTSIAKIFQKMTTQAPENTKSVLKEMQDMVVRAVSSKLERPVAETTSLTQALDEFFKVDEYTVSRLDGAVNTLETLHTEVKKQVQEYVAGIERSGALSEDQIDVLKDQWNNYTQAFIDSTYDIVLNKGQQNSLVNTALQQVEVDGERFTDFNGNVAWKKLIQFDNPDTIVMKVKELFKQGIRNDDGTTSTYTDRQAQKIGEYFRKLYLEKEAAARERLINNNRVKNNSPANVVSDFLKDRGFFNLMKDPDGKPLLSQADWNGFLKALKEQLVDVSGNQSELRRKLSGTDYIANKLQDYLSSIKDSDGNPKYNDYQKNIITETAIDEIVAKLAPNTLDANDIEKLIALDQVNGGNAFNEGTQAAIEKLLGVTGVTQNVLNQLRGLAQAAQAIMNNSVGQVQANGMTVNRGAYAFQAMAEIDRRIKELVRENNISKSNQQRVFKYFSDLLGSNAISLLINPNNIIENINTQFGSNIVESINLLVKSPKLWAKSWTGFQKDYWAAWASYERGGASNDMANEAELTNEIQTSERLRIRTLIKEYTEGKGMKGVAAGVTGATLKLPAYLASIVSRAVMNSFDAATTASLLRKRMLSSTYGALSDLGMSGKEIEDVMGSAINIPQSVKDEIKTENQRIAGILRQNGIYVTDAIMRQNYRDMLLSAYETVIQDRGKDIGASTRQTTQVTKALVQSSLQQAKALGGKKQILSKDWVSKIIYAGANGILLLQKDYFKRASESEKIGRLKESASLQLKGAIYQSMFGKFVGGVANFMVLAYTATPLGLYAANSLRRQRNMYAELHGVKNVDGKFKINVFDSDPEVVRRYSEIQEQMRSIATRSIVGTLSLAGFLAARAATTDDDEDDTWLKNLNETKSGRRMLQKHLPVSMALATAYLDGKGSDEDLEQKIENLFTMVESYTGKDFDKYTNFKRSLKYGGYSQALTDFGVGLIPSYNLNQAEQIQKFMTTVQSATNRDIVSDVEFDEEVSKEIYQDAEEIIDKILVNSAIDAFGRGFTNRFKDK